MRSPECRKAKLDPLSNFDVTEKPFLSD
jgi:hypothetical protein